jgi:hypothetical protein
MHRLELKTLQDITAAVEGGYAVNVDTKNYIVECIDRSHFITNLQTGDKEPLELSPGVLNGANFYVVINATTRIKIVNMMEIYGGSFARHIGRALACADYENEARLIHTFNDLFIQYLKYKG